LQEWAYYFIAFCALNLCLLLWQSRRTQKKLSRMQMESEKLRGMDEKIFRLYQEIENMLDNFDAYVDEVHEEQEARRKELVEMSRQATTLYLQVMQPASFGGLRGAERQPEMPPAELTVPAVYTAPEPTAPDPGAEALRNKVKSSKLLSRDRTELDKLTTKGQKVRYLMGRGFTLEEVARELDIGKGEIKLIVDLDK